MPFEYILLRHEFNQLGFNKRTSRGAATKSSFASVVANSDASCIILFTAVDLKFIFGREPDGAGLDIFVDSTESRVRWMIQVYLCA
jgi:hypothetical protein